MENKSVNHLFIVVILMGIVAVGCKSKKNKSQSAVSWNTVQDTTQRVTTIKGGLQGPESAKYDSEQDVYFISNSEGGFISRAQAGGTIDSLKFMSGTAHHPLQGATGMDIIGDTLFVAGSKGVHGFNRYTGKHLSFTDFSKFDPGFLNDVSVGPDSALYVTDSGKPVLYRMAGGKAAIATDSLPYPANGITYDKKNHRLLLAAWGDGNNTFLTWDPINQTQGKDGHGESSKYDGIEFVGKNFIVSSHADSTLQLIKGGKGRVFVKVPALPADIGLDTKRHRVAVPYIALNRVDIWQLPNQK